MAVRGTSRRRGEERIVSPPPRCVESVAPWTGAKTRRRRTGGADHFQPRAAGLSPDRFPAESSRSCPRRAPAQNARRESSPSHRPNQGGECAHEARYAQSGSPLLSEPPLWMASVSLVISIPYWQLYPNQVCPLHALVTRPCAHPARCRLRCMLTFWILRSASFLHPPPATLRPNQNKKSMGQVYGWIR